MARYTVLARCFLKLSGESFARVVEKGDVVEFDGVPNASLLPQDAAARAAYVKWADARPRPGPSIAAKRQHNEVTARAAAFAQDTKPAA
jgi:hypothetical protein